MKNTDRIEYKINSVMYDMEAKEHVMISNGICVLDHSSPEAFAKSHGKNGMGACEYVAHEAIAIRAFPCENGKVQIGWTYRGVDHTKLRECDQSAKTMFEAVLSRKASKYNIGRV